MTAHVFGETALPDLLDAGIDCIEHGTGLSTDLIDQMVAQGIALVPTVKHLENFPSYADAGEAEVPRLRRPHARPARRRRETIVAAYDAGVRDLCRHRRRGSAAARADRDRGAELAAYGLTAARRPGRSLLARAGVARSPADARRGRPGRLLRLSQPTRWRTSACCPHPTRIVLRGAVVA